MRAMERETIGDLSSRECVHCCFFCLMMWLSPWPCEHGWSRHLRKPTRMATAFWTLMRSTSSYTKWMWICLVGKSSRCFRWEQYWEVRVVLITWNNSLSLTAHLYSYVSFGLIWSHIGLSCYSCEQTLLTYFQMLASSTLIIPFQCTHGSV